MSFDQQTTSSYLQHLPAIFSEDPFVGRFLMAFEHVLTGPPQGGGGSDSPRGLEETIATLSALFDPKETRDDFIPWLAGWVALALRSDWTGPQQRDFLANIVPLYRRRGTKENLAELMKIYLGGATPEIIDVDESEFQIGVHSTVGKDTSLSGTLAPHFFKVNVTMPNPDPAELERNQEIARALIELQKPAHTDFELHFVFTTMQIGKTSTIGKNTLLGIEATT
ncbi:MAG TPA: phage tail protein [Blastocatellia bacterium]|nr:phage tail protein [Blastocatellia bacterium]